MLLAYAAVSDCLRIMTAFDKLRERSKLLKFWVRLQNSVFYPIVFAAICAYSGVNGKEIYLPCIYFFTALIVLTLLFSHDLKPLIVPAFMIYYAIGMDVAENHYLVYAQPTFDKTAVPHFIICAALIAPVLIYRLIANGILKEMFFRRGIYFWGIIFFDIALMLGGIFSPMFGLRSLLWSLITVIVLTLGYMLFTVIISHSDDGIAYTCKTLVLFGFAICGQIMINSYRAYRCGTLFYEREGITHIYRMLAFNMSWGIPTIVGAVLVPPLIACFYLMYKRRFPALSLFSALFFGAAIAFVTTRSAIVVGVIFAFICLLLCLANGRNKIFNRISASAIFLLLLTALILLFVNMSSEIRQKLLDTLGFFRFNVNADSLDTFSTNRLSIWLDGIADFKAHPIFGEGFLYGSFSPEKASPNLYNNMYHNIALQILASLGIVGAIAFLIHLKHMLEVTLRQFSVDKLILVLVPLSIIAMSMVDNFFFYPNFLIIYTAFLACSEVSLEQSRQKKLDNVKKIPNDRRPRVVFTYVEAGKGHIIPTKNVFESFKRKYGNQVELIESHFFTETLSPEMEQTEILFRRAVQNQNRSPVLSFLCKLGNLIAGDTFALFVLLRMTLSGKKTNRRAVAHVKELDADIIYTAHWSIPFYINQIKGPHPYTVCFCPDVYSNGAFNVDCNHFLISSDVGYKQVAHRMRMYAGGNISQIPFPMRPEAEAFKSEDTRAECRKKLGISEGEFTVVLCDGGYGLAKLEKTVHLLQKSKQKITVIALCGMNKELYIRLLALSEHSQKNVRLIPVDFTDKVLEYIAAADVFVGKSGANSVAEPAALGIPIIITKCITYIERGIKNYYVHKIKGAIYLPSAHRAARRIEHFASEPSLLEPYRKSLVSSPRFHYDAEATADILWEHIQELRQD